jgi:hypothetical protein
VWATRVAARLTPPTRCAAAKRKPDRLQLFVLSHVRCELCTLEQCFWLSCILQTVCDGDGHTEALRVWFDPSILPYEQLLQVTRDCCLERLHNHVKLSPTNAWYNGTSRKSHPLRVQCSVHVCLHCTYAVQKFFEDHDPTHHTKPQYKSAIWCVTSVSFSPPLTR